MELFVPKMRAMSSLFGGALPLAVGFALLSEAVGNLSLMLTDRRMWAGGVVLVGWSVLALVARQVLCGKPRLQPSTLLLLWCWFRASLSLATLILLVGWAVALLFHGAISSTLVKSLFISALANAVTALVGGACLNSLLAIRAARPSAAR